MKMTPAKEWASKMARDAMLRQGSSVQTVLDIQKEAIRHCAEVCGLDVRKLLDDAKVMKEKKDDLNAYLYETQAMAHQLDYQRLHAAASDLV